MDNNSEKKQWFEYPQVCKELDAEYEIEADRRWKERIQTMRDNLTTVQARDDIDRLCHLAFTEGARHKRNEAIAPCVPLCPTCQMLRNGDSDEC